MIYEGKKYNDYIKINKPLEKKNTESFKNKIYSLGYIEGVYDEHEYIRYIPEDEECFDIYARGYKDGEKDRVNDTSKLSFPKSSWIIKLAYYDYQDGYKDRNLSEKAKKIYDLHYTDLINSTPESENERIDIDYNKSL